MEPDDGGARIVRIAAEGADRYDNLILLCARNHGAAETSAAGATAADLLRLKDEHEEWVRASAPAETGQSPGSRYDPCFAGVTLLPRIRGGRALVRLLAGVHSMQYDHDPLGASEERLLEEFLQYLKGLLDVWGQYHAAERRRVVLHLDAQLDRLGEAGLLLCAARHASEAKLAGAVGEWVSLRVWVLREPAPGPP